MDWTEGAGAAYTAGTGAMYSTTGAGAADTAGAGAMYSSTGAGAADTAGAGATHSITGAGVTCSRSACVQACAQDLSVAVMGSGSHRHTHRLLLVPPKSTKSPVTSPPRGASNNMGVSCNISHGCRPLGSQQKGQKTNACEPKPCVVVVVVVVVVVSAEFPQFSVWRHKLLLLVHTGHDAAHQGLETTREHSAMCIATSKPHASVD